MERDPSRVGVTSITTSRHSPATTRRIVRRPRGIGATVTPLISMPMPSVAAPSLPKGVPSGRRGKSG